MQNISNATPKMHVKSVWVKPMSHFPPQRRFKEKLVAADDGQGHNIHGCFSSFKWL
jgi:hypothetical protein